MINLEMATHAMTPPAESNNILTTMLKDKQGHLTGCGEMFSESRKSTGASSPEYVLKLKPDGMVGAFLLGKHWKVIVLRARILGEWVPVDTKVEEYL
jgi:hypothetical protein